MSTFTIFLIIYLICDLYSFFGLKSLFVQKNTKFLFIVFYLGLSVFTLYCFYQIWFIAKSYSMFSGTKVNFYLGMFLTIFVAKLFFSLFLILQDGPRYLIGFYNFILSFFTERVEVNYIPSRRKAITGLAVFLASVPFMAMLHGVTRGKYRFTVNRLSLNLKNLPKEFNGYKLVQISDIHAGSLDSVQAVKKAVSMINELNPDAVLFTGDLVNSNKDEVDPYIDELKKIESKDGKYAVLGNHDYYGLYDLTEKEKESYWLDFYSKFEKLGFDLLNNENRSIYKGESKINIIGVENWGAGRWFPKEGDLELALANIKEDECNILMSHDPTHWDEKVLVHKKHIDLTLSGHTHGFQFGIDMPGFKWSPAQYRYKRWIGLHEEKEQLLYINKGLGFLAFPGRVGMWPEITLIELKSV